MKPYTVARAAFVALPLVAASLRAQSRRVSAEGIGTTARVLLVGTRPEDEDNALIAWLSLGRHVETAYLSLTRGESGVNVIGSERESALAIVRTAELLAERERDGAHQYFSRAYDFGSPRADSAVDAAWPHDSLLKDVVSIIRAFRPQVVVALHRADSTEHDATRRLAARLAYEAFSAAADTVRLPASQTSKLPAWSVSRLYTLVDSAPAGESTVVAVDVGEFDRESGRSYAELGAEIRRLQRTQPAVAAPAVGHVRRLLRLDSTRVGGGSSDLFEHVDTTWVRFRGALPDSVLRLLDSLQTSIARSAVLASRSAPDSLAIALALVVKRAGDVRDALSCRNVGSVAACGGVPGDLAASLGYVRERATRALVGAAGVVIDGTVDREAVAAGDSVPVTVTIRNAGSRALPIRRLMASSRTAWVPLLRDTETVVAADSVGRWSANIRVNLPSYHWWQLNGLQDGAWLHILPGQSLAQELISGEDRIPTSGVEATIGIGGIGIPVVEQPLVYRSVGTVRGDNRHPLAGVRPISVLLERTAEYERAGLPIDRLFRVYASTSHTVADTLDVTLELPHGLKADSTKRTVVVPPLGGRNVFFRIRGTLTPGSDTIRAAVFAWPPSATVHASTPVMRDFRRYDAGTIQHDYPHIPSQQFFRAASDRLEAVDIRVPAGLRVAYIKGTDDLQTPLGQLQIRAQVIEPSLLSVVDLSVFSTVLVGAGAVANDALVGATPSLRDFMRKGGTVVVLPGQEEIAGSGLLPYPISFAGTPRVVSEPDAPVQATDARSPLLNWPNVITANDFERWSGERARDVPQSFDSHYRVVLSTGSVDHPATAAAILVAPVGRGRIIYSSLSLDRELTAVHPGAARLLVNLLSAGLAAGPRS